jgi:hypothetical protein
MLRISIRWLKVGATYRFHDVCLFISKRMMKTNKSLWFCFAGRTMRGTEVYALQRTCVGSR